MAITTILFDLDNTLIDRKRVFEEMLMQKIGEYHSENVADIVQEIIKWDNNGNQHRLVTFQQYVDTYNTNVTAKELNDYWNENSGKIIYVYEDVYDTLLYLKKKYRLGIVSNGNPESQRRKIQQLPFIELFEFVIVSGELGVDKPDVRIFDYAAKMMQVPNEECAFVGDNFRCDILGASHAGMLAIWKCDKEQFNENYICIEHISELKEYL